MSSASEGLPDDDSRADAAALRGLKDALTGEALRREFAAVGVTGVRVPADERRLLAWLAEGRHGKLGYMARHHARRARADELVPGTLRVISLAVDYWPEDAREPWAVMADPSLAYISRYATGRDYHKRLRKRARDLGEWLVCEAERVLPGSRYRVFTDSGPLLERAFARDAGLGWLGKHTCLIRRDGGSLFFLAEILTTLPLPADPPMTQDHCGRCTDCISACPTDAIVAPYRLDARRCISYLTIEQRGPIPVELRPLLGNRVFGCDDCQLVCPWNRFAQGARDPAFAPRHGLDAPALVDLFALDKIGWAALTEGSALRRPGYAGWLRNLSVALGNALRTLPAASPAAVRIRAALEARAGSDDALVAEHVAWALAQAPDAEA